MNTEVIEQRESTIGNITFIIPKEVDIQQAELVQAHIEEIKEEIVAIKEELAENVTLFEEYKGTYMESYGQALLDNETKFIEDKIRYEEKRWRIIRDLSPVLRIVEEAKYTHVTV